MKIDVASPESWFAFFYVFSFAATFILLVIFSRRQKIPLLPLLLIMTSASLFTIIGSRLSTMPASEWLRFNDPYVHGHMGRSATGGLIAGLAALALSVRLLKPGSKVLALYAWIAPLGFGMQKAGCFFNGCCFGKVTVLPWGVSYPAGTAAHYTQFAGNLIASQEQMSMPVHPVQLYEMILFFAIAFIVWRSLNRWKGKWSPVLFGLCLFFAARFLALFLRDPHASQIGTGIVLGLSVMHWFLLAAAVLSAFLLLLNEKFAVGADEKTETSIPGLKILVIFIIADAIVIYIFRGLFTSWELLALNIRFIPAILLCTGTVFIALANSKYRVAIASLMVLPLFLVLSSFVPDTLRTGNIRDFYKGLYSYRQLDFAMSLGDLNSTAMYNPHEGQCGTAYTQEDYRHLYRMAGAGFSLIRKEQEHETTLRFVLYGGVNRETNLTKQWERKDFLFGINASARFDVKWIGFGAGAHIGNIRWAALGPIDKITFDRGTRFMPFMPEAYLRIGVRDAADLQYTYGFTLPSPVPVLMHELSLGTGLGSAETHSLRFGAAISDQYSTLFLSATAQLGTKTGVFLKYYLPGDDFYYTWPNTDVRKRSPRLNFGMSYRFGFR